MVCYYETGILFVAIICHGDELSSSLCLSWLGCLLTDSELFILFAENSQSLLKISVIPILLTFTKYLVALNQQTINSTHHCGTQMSDMFSQRSSLSKKCNVSNQIDVIYFKNLVLVSGSFTNYDDNKRLEGSPKIPIICHRLG